MLFGLQLVAAGFLKVEWNFQGVVAEWKLLEGGVWTFGDTPFSQIRTLEFPLLVNAYLVQRLLLILQNTD